MYFYAQHRHRWSYNHVVRRKRQICIRDNLVMYLMPLIGFFLAPVYPTINSTILSSLPKHMHSSMAGSIGVFSALGGIRGSLFPGNVFQQYNGVVSYTHLQSHETVLDFVCRLLLEKKIHTS